jgi:hypothetical protein
MSQLPWLLVTLLAGAVQSAQSASQPDTPAMLGQIETAYADFNDAYGAVSLLDSNPGRYPDSSYGGRTRAGWEQLYSDRRAELQEWLRKVRVGELPSADARAVRLMRAAVAESDATPTSLAPTGRCVDAQRQDLQLQPLQEALYACFAELANSLHFEHDVVTRVAAFDLLARMPQRERRQSLFMAFVPLWQALNGDGGAHSPYRRMIRLAAAQASSRGSPIDAAARTVGVTPAQTERWLEQPNASWGRSFRARRYNRSTSATTAIWGSIWRRHK